LSRTFSGAIVFALSPTTPFPRPFAILAQDRPAKPIRAGACSVAEICIDGITQKQDGDFMYLRGECKIETTETLIQADEIDYNTQTHWAHARGHVHFESFDDGDKLDTPSKMFLRLVVSWLLVVAPSPRDRGFEGAAPDIGSDRRDSGVQSSHRLTLDKPRRSSSRM
jgi:hypothetical protein